MKSFRLWLFAPLLAAQQPVPFVPLDGVTNNASYLPGCSPGGGIAPGSLFTVFGGDIGPASLTQVKGFPLSTNLAGVSLKIAISGATYDAWPL